MNCLITYIGLGHEKKDSMQGPQQSEIIILYCTTLGFIYKNKEYNHK